MPKCPECGYCWKTKAKVCPRKIAKNQSKSLISNYENAKKMFDDVEDIVGILRPDHIIKTSTLIELYGVQDKTSGDLLRKMLEILVCRGYLDKIKFGNGKSGHIYKKFPENFQCEHWIKDAEDPKRGACAFDWKLAKEIDYDKLEEKDVEAVA